MSTTTVTQRAMAASSSSVTASIMLPTSSDVSPSELESFSRIVRFDSECVLIPDMNRTKSPKMLTKSYSLPLWKRRTSNQDTETSGVEEVTMTPVSEETHVVLNIPIPTFITRASRSPTRGRRSASMSPSAASKPLSPCLVHRTPSASPVSHNKRPSASMRRPSLPIYHRPKDRSALTTVPLRACCLDCERITEECLQEGDRWKEKFTKAARRRRSASLDNATPYTPPGSAGFAAVAAVSGGGTVSSAVIPTSRPGKFALTVDEVDKRRKSQEITLANEDLTCKRTLSTPNPSASYCPGVSPYDAVSPALRRSRPRNSDFSSGSTSSSPSDNSPLSISTSPLLESSEKRKPRSSPIPEEDEAQLFPLPKRSPSNSPSASLNHSPRSSPLPSPNGSTAFLPVAATCAVPTHAAALISKDSLSSRGSNDEDGKLKGSLSRKCSKGLLVPPDHTHRSGSTVTGTTPESPVLPKRLFESPLSSPTLLSSSDLTARPVSIHTSSSPGTSSTVPEASSPPTGHKHGLSLHLHFPARHHNTNSPSVPAPSAGLPSPTSPSFSHRQVPGSPKQRKPSLTHQFVRAGEAMLKGVSSIGGGGGGVGGV